MQEPLQILTDTIGFMHYVYEPLIITILTDTIGFQHYVLEPLKRKIHHKASTMQYVKKARVCVWGGGQNTS